MSTQPPDDAPPPRDAPPAGQTQQYDYQPAPHQGHAGPWILAAAVVLVLGALAAVFIHNEGTDTQTVINRTSTVNTTSVERTAPTVTQTATTVTQPPKTVTVEPKTTPTETTTTTP